MPPRRSIKEAYANLARQLKEEADVTGQSSEELIRKAEKEGRSRDSSDFWVKNSQTLAAASSIEPTAAAAELHEPAQPHAPAAHHNPLPAPPAAGHQFFVPQQPASAPPLFVVPSSPFGDLYNAKMQDERLAQQALK